MPPHCTKTTKNDQKYEKWIINNILVKILDILYVFYVLLLK